MSGNRGDVWGLNETYVEASEGEWSKVSYASTASPSPKPWVADGTIDQGYAEYMYSFFSNTHFEKYDIYNDCIVGPCRAIQVSGTYKHTAGYDFITATSNQDYAFITGTAAPNPYSSKSERSIYRMDFSNDTASSWASADHPRTSGLGVGNRHYGWFIGGHARGANEYLTNGFYRPDLFPDLGGGGTSGLYAERTTIERLDYSNSTISYAGSSKIHTDDGRVLSTFNYLTYGRYRGYCAARAHAASSCNNDYAIVVSMSDNSWRHQYEDSVTSKTRVSYKYDFSNDTFSYLETLRPAWVSDWDKIGLFSAGGNADYMWITGGTTSSTQSQWDYPSNIPNLDGREIMRIDYSNDTFVDTFRNKTLLNQRGHGQSGNQSYGYLNYGNLNVRQKINYANDTAQIDFQNTWASSVDDRLRAIMSGDGLDPIPDYIDTVPSNDWDYRSTQEVALTTSVSQSQWNLPTTHPQVSYPTPPASSPASYFYFAGGSHPSSTDNSIYRFAYANDSELPSYRGQTNSGYDAYAKYHASTNNANYAWLNRGNLTITFYPGDSVTGEPIQRLDFSNDSSVSTRNNSYKQYDHCASGNANYGWWFGGRGEQRAGTPSFWAPYGQPKPYIYRTDYSNDSANPVYRADDFQRSRADATTDGSYAWIYSGSYIATSPTLGGYEVLSYRYDTEAASNWASSIYRYDFSNDTTDTVYKVSMTSGTYPRKMDSDEGIEESPPLNRGIRAVGNNSMAIIMHWFEDDFLTGTYSSLPFRPFGVPAYDAYPAYGSGGNGPVQKMCKYDYSNDTTAPLPWAYQDGIIYQDSTNEAWDTTGNNDYGYFSAQGRLGKLDYANSSTSSTNRYDGKVTYAAQKFGFFPSLQYAGIPYGTPGGGSGTFRNFTAFSGARNH